MVTVGVGAGAAAAVGVTAIAVVTTRGAMAAVTGHFAKAVITVIVYVTFQIVGNLPRIGRIVQFVTRITTA
tara:strand:+ start:224 stop:436 length:213 start_codon:yes stop_codon:yes gene_type:complete